MPAPRTPSSPARPSADTPGPTNAPARRRRPNRGQHNSAGPRVPKSSPASELEAALDATLATPAPSGVSFADLGLPTSLVIALGKRGIGSPFAIQARAIPDVLAGRDVLGRAQTGGGKTLAFGLPMLARLASSGSRRTSKAPRGLVLVPTRELATQVADALRPFGETLGLKLACVFGGAPYGKQLDALNRGVDLVVATPGRLIDLIERRACVLSAIEIAVLDEADHMADLGFMPAVTKLLDQTSSDGQRLLFSATLDRGVDKLVRGYLTQPALHAVAPAVAPVDAMEHRVFALRPQDKVAVVAEVAARPARTLIFVRTKHGADRLAKQLERTGVAAAAIHGNLKQNQRQRALDAFGAGHPRVLVATDVAARGIHVDDVDLVVHFDPPNDSKDYLHRSGRTARAGATGTALTLVLPDEAGAVAALHKGAGVSPVAVQVRPGHAAVRQLANSGEAVPVIALPTPTRAGGARDGIGSKPTHDASRRPDTKRRREGETRSPEERSVIKARQKSRGKLRHRRATHSSEPRGARGEAGSAVPSATAQQSA
jgi:superfamily II DNA/RNA helicase